MTASPQFLMEKKESHQGWIQHAPHRPDSEKSQDGSAGKDGWPPGSPPCTITAKITIELQNNYHPEPLENRAQWKSDNQGIKEITSIQMGRRSREVDTWNERCPCFYPHVVGKNWEGNLRSKGSEPYTRPLSPGIQHQEDKAP